MRATVADRRIGGPPLAQIVRQHLGHGRQQRQRKGDARLGPNDLERIGVPVDVLQLQPNYFAGTKAVGTHQQQKRVVAQAAGGGPVDGLQQPLNVAPR